MIVAMTGATGFLGSNLLFEIFKQNFTQLDRLKIFALGRAKTAEQLGESLEKLMANDGRKYLGLSQEEYEQKLQPIVKQCIIPIPADLTQDNLALSLHELSNLKQAKIDFFFHVAALTDLRCDRSVEFSCSEINVKGTQRVLDLVSILNLREFIYIGTAFSCGMEVGEIQPDSINQNNLFRNPYESSKLKSELLVRDFFRNKAMKFRVFRPSVLAGRLIERPIGTTKKFDVFYSIPAFIVNKKYEIVNSLNKLYSEIIEMPLRVHLNYNSGLNIVPVDYAVKIIYGACIHSDPSTFYHIANLQPIPHREYGKWMLEAIAVKGCIFSPEEPINKNSLEKLYYRTVGRVLQPYMLSEPMDFKTDNLRSLENKLDLECPPINKDNFMKLMDFAKQQYFGLNLT
jgi:nucleoside-diphosphate-sugar epimerase